MSTYLINYIKDGEMVFTYLTARDVPQALFLIGPYTTVISVTRIIYTFGNAPKKLSYRHYKKHVST